MTVRTFLTVTEVMTMHSKLIELHGGASGVRDAGALEAALHRPQIGYYSDTVEEAAALFESLAMNHAFIDGNKRIAFAVTDVFLRINGYRINSRPMDIYTKMMEMLENGAFNMGNIEPWLRQIVIKSA